MAALLPCQSTRPTCRPTHLMHGSACSPVQTNRKFNLVQLNSEEFADRQNARQFRTSVSTHEQAVDGNGHSRQLAHAPPRATPDTLTIWQKMPVSVCVKIRLVAVVLLTRATSESLPRGSHNCKLTEFVCNRLSSSLNLFFQNQLTRERRIWQVGRRPVINWITKFPKL